MVGLAVDEHLAAMAALEPDEESGDAAPPRTHEPGDAEYSARRHVKVSPSGPVPGSCTPVTSSIGSGRAVVAASGNAWSIGRPTIAETTWSRVVDRVRPSPDDGAVAEHGDLVGDPFHLGQPVADVADGDAVVGEAADQVEHPFGVVRRQDCGRLVEDDGDRVTGEHLGHLDELSPGDRQPADGPVDAQRRRSDALRSLRTCARCARRSMSGPRRGWMVSITLSATERSFKSDSSW